MPSKRRAEPLERPVRMTANQRAPGALNLNGIHYQLLRSLFQASRILQHDIDPVRETPQWSRIVLEPRTGGDLRVERPGGVEIEQMKTRAGRPWPLSEIIHEILPDLYRAFKVWDPHRPDRPVVRARFVTDGKRGEWEEVEGFFKRLPASDAVPDPMWKTLNATDRLKCRAGRILQELTAKGMGLTEQGLFRHISQVLNESNEPTPEDDRKVWRLLRVFEPKWQLSEESLRREVLASLRRRSSRIEATEPVFWQLLGCFLDRGKDSETIDPRDLLADFGLASIDLGDREALIHQGRKLLGDFLANRGYDPDCDVRDRCWIVRGERKSGHLESKTPVTVLHGESGQGKSWALYAKARSAEKRGELALIIESTHDRTADAIRDRAAARFCNEIWDLDGTKSLERLAKEIQKSDPAVAQHWLSLFVDGVQDMALAREIAACDWGSLGIRLFFALTTTGQENLERDLKGCSEDLANAAYP